MYYVADRTPSSTEDSNSEESYVSATNIEHLEGEIQRLSVGSYFLQNEYEPLFCLLSVDAYALAF